MKLLKRNCVQVGYRRYMGKTEVLSDGRHTGQYDIQYDDPVWFSGNLSVPSGQVSNQMYSIVADYTHVLLLDLTDTGIEEDGLIVKGDDVYEIKAVRESMNVTSIALKKRPRNGK